MRASLLIEVKAMIARGEVWGEMGKFIARLVDEREALLGALKQIAGSDHPSDGGPECDHPYIADRAIAKAEAE